MTPQDRTIRAADAKHLLENPLFVEAWDAVANHLQMAAMSCEPENKDKAQRVILSIQLLAAVKREVIRAVQDGLVAQVQLKELEPKRNFFRR